MFIREYLNYETELRLSTPDAYEPNNTIEAASCIAAQFYHEFTLHATTDVDFHYFHIETTEPVYTFYSSMQENPLFTNVALYDTDAQTILHASDQTAYTYLDRPQFQYQFTTPGIYYLKFFGYDESVEYGLYVKEPLGVCETGLF